MKKSEQKNSASGRGKIMPDKSIKREVVFHGIPASPGIAMGIVQILGKDESLLDAEPEKRNLTAGEVDAETARFKEALEKTRNETKALMARVKETVGQSDASIFDAQFLILDDKMLINEVISGIGKKLLTAENAFRQTVSKYIAAISAIQDPYLHERAADIKDVAERLLAHLKGGKGSLLLENLPGPRIIVAKDLTPSDTALLDKENVLAFATESGSKTSHSAILARSIRIPAIVSMNRFYERLEDGDFLIIDGFLGIAVLNPEKETVELYQQKEKGKARLYDEYLRETQLKSETVDGYRVELAANVENAETLDDIKKFGAAGIGLFRTEYLYMNRDSFPSEEEQFEVYKKVAMTLEGRPAIIRTLDLGGDKLSALVNTSHEQNPFLGLRAVRLCLAHPELLKTQMRAILRAGVYGKLRMMFPMVSGVRELDDLLRILDEVKSNLQKSNQRFDGSMEIGVMIEIPSAALVAEHLAEKVDFFSIGTNDLVQYTLAVDRNNEQVASLYEPTHPGVLSLIAMTVRAANKHGIWVGVCGESGGDPLCIPLLVGLGVKELSMSPISIGQTRRLIRKISMREVEQLAALALAARDGGEALALSRKYLEQRVPAIL
ncbi:MAG: phosphoenolpyruvate--protein phosphotransferase, partial [Lentisphaeria bacterium]|nr:phosphoenolpyruvate--protein phosphotransferase [Lentisphaeria bacterium]